MTALTANTAVYGRGIGRYERHTGGVRMGVQVFSGALLFRDPATGMLEPATAKAVGDGYTVAGVAIASADARDASQNGEFSVDYATGNFAFMVDPGDPIAVATGQEVYVLDDRTVAATDQGGTLTPGGACLYMGTTTPQVVPPGMVFIDFPSPGEMVDAPAGAGAWSSADTLTAEWSPSDASALLAISGDRGAIGADGSYPYNGDTAASVIDQSGNAVVVDQTTLGNRPPIDLTTALGRAALELGNNGVIRTLAHGPISAVSQGYTVICSYVSLNAAGSGYVINSASPALTAAIKDWNGTSQMASSVGGAEIATASPDPSTATRWDRYVWTNGVGAAAIRHFRDGSELTGATEGIYVNGLFGSGFISDSFNGDLHLGHISVYPGDLAGADLTAAVLHARQRAGLATAHYDFGDVILNGQSNMAAQALTAAGNHASIVALDLDALIFGTARGDVNPGTASAGNEYAVGAAGIKLANRILGHQGGTIRVICNAINGKEMSYFLEGSVDPSERGATVGANNNWDEVSLAVTASGMAPKAYVMNQGEQDNALTPVQIQALHQSFYEDVMTRYGSTLTRYVVVKMTRAHVNARDGIALFAVGKDNVRVVDMDDVAYPSGILDAAIFDGVHYTDLGYKILGDRMWEAMAS